MTRRADQRVFCFAQAALVPSVALSTASTHEPEQASDESRGRAPPATRWSAILVAPIVLFGAVMSVAMPGLALWIADEPKLIINALLANASGRPAPHGLLGTFDFFYGPIPTWLYQLILLVTHDVYAIVTIHAAAFYGLTIAAAFWLAGSAGFRRDTVLALAVCPAIAFYSRQLWDNSFNIPLSIGLLALYASYLRRPAAWKLVTLGALMGVMISIHTSAVTLVAGLLAHAVWRHRSSSVRFVGQLSIGCIAALLPLSPYIYSQVPVAIGVAPKPVRFVTGLIDGYPYPMPKQSRGQSSLFAFSGSRVLSADFRIMPAYADGPAAVVQKVARAGTWVVHLMFGIGVLHALKIATRRKRRAGATVESHLAIVALTIIVLQAALFAIIRPIAVDHYFNGSLAAYLVLVFVGREQIPGKLGQALAVMLVVCLGLYTSLCLMNLRETNGQQLRYGPTLGEQRRVLQEVRDLSTSRLQTDVIHLVFFPESVRSLWVLEGHSRQPATSDAVPLVISKDRRTGSLEVLMEAPPGHTSRKFLLDLGVPLQPMK